MSDCSNHQQTTASNVQKLKQIDVCAQYYGGGRFGQSLTAIAKLAPNATFGEGLSVHYSGGSSLAKDVTAWLKKNGVAVK